MDWIRDHLWESWLAAAMILGVLEMFSMDFFLLMLAGGALVGMVAALLGASLPLQVILAAGTALAMVLFVRPMVRRRMDRAPELTVGHGKLVGSQGVVTEEITADTAGRVRLSGEIWSAKPYDETLVIAPGQTVEVFEIRGATALVHPVAGSVGSADLQVPGLEP